MTKALKELIENAPVLRKGKFSCFLIVPNGVYNGFWGSNRFCNIMLFGFKDDKWYKIADHDDVFNICDDYKGGYRRRYQTFSLDIPKEYKVPRIWFSNPVYVDYTLEISSVSGEYTEREVEE